MTFRNNLDAYLKQRFDAHIEDFSVTEACTIRIYVVDADGNDHVWEMAYVLNKDVVTLSTIVDNTVLSCTVSDHPWAVGAILLS